MATSIGVTAASLQFAPIINYGEFEWYQFPVSTRQPFSLIVCDGPPSDTRGGRYGLLPVVRSMLSPRCIILLDDGIRSEEQEIVRRWQSEASIFSDFVGAHRPYFRLTVEGELTVLGDGRSVPQGQDRS